ncbi:hypothetical protein JYU23_01165 [bacterium AH-315-C07]|nr:hypothetical protein [bacterium AH-315-C07]
MPYLDSDFFDFLIVQPKLYDFYKQEYGLAKLDLLTLIATNRLHQHYVMDGTASKVHKLLGFSTVSKVYKSLRLLESHRYIKDISNPEKTLGRISRYRVLYRGTALLDRYPDILDEYCNALLPKKSRTTSDIYRE